TDRSCIGRRKQERQAWTLGEIGQECRRIGLASPSDCRVIAGDRARSGLIGKRRAWTARVSARFSTKRDREFTSVLYFVGGVAGYRR
ncbi:MAG: hypothetical protein ABJZ69_19955, partial [Hyphomicrobiales bacterium]